MTRDLLELKEDVARTTDMLGHSSTDSTRVYDRRGEERERRAARKRYTPPDLASADSL